MYNPIEILEDFRKKGTYNIRKIDIINDTMLSTGKDFLLMHTIVISIANNGWVASIYPDLYRVSSKKWTYFSWASNIIAGKYDQAIIKQGKLVVQEGEVNPGLILLEFISFMEFPVDNESFQSYTYACNMLYQLGWGKILNYPFYPINTQDGIELYSLYGPIIFNDTPYAPIKLTASNIYYFPQALDYLTEDEVKELEKDKYISINDGTIKIVVEDEKYRYIDTIIKSLLKIIGIRYGKNWIVIDNPISKKDPLYSSKISYFNHIIPDYNDVHTMRKNVGAIQYKKTRMKEK